MKRFCENAFCHNEAVTEVQVSVEQPADGVRSLCSVCEEAYTWGYQHGRLTAKGLTIEPPPDSKDDEPLYRVVYMIDVNASDVVEAARYTHRIMTDPGSMAPVLHVIDSEGHESIIDLSEQPGTEPETTDPEELARRFVLDAASKCPKCGGQNIEFGSFNVEGQSAYQPADCQDCKASFFVIYRLVGFGTETEGQTEIHTIIEDFGAIAPDRLTPTDLHGKLQEVLSSIDVGGEQSRQFAHEIKLLKQVLAAIKEGSSARSDF